ncbi:DUF3576 domain-containing protein [Paenirhodobacter sp.]|uniref:DUF3576 domain-containing protein n=1 Tax=Paenirhodobacter sp. TaxID=1965326 RepID=UPI003B3CA4CD
MIVLAACGGTEKRAYPDATQYSHISGEENVSAMDQSPNQTAARNTSVWDLFSNRQDPNVKIAVNKYLWNASLEVLNFLPVQSVDPFSGLIVTGYGTPPGGGRAYRASIHITDPALDARSLKVALETKGGAVSPETVKAVEDAILTRARQLRVADSQR